MIVQDHTDEEKEGSNRTFMELKFETYLAIWHSRLVLIAPLWN